VRRLIPRGGLDWDNGIHRSNRLSTRVFLIRHGVTAWNTDRRIQGHRDIPLSEEGRRQAARVAEALAGEPLAAVYSSDLSRALQTGEVVAAPHGVPVIPEPDLREARFGEWEGLDEGQISAAYPEEYRLWREDSFLHRPPGGETIQETQARVAPVYERVLAAHAGQTVALVAHGGPIKALVLYAIGAPLAVYPRLRMRNASVSLIEVGERGPVLALYNQVCQLRLE